MTLIESIELAQEKLNESTFLGTVFTERSSWSKNTNIIVAISEKGVCFIPKFDNTKCFISLEDLKADDWKLLFL